MVAQPGSALVWGARGRWFESSPPDLARVSLMKRTRAFLFEVLVVLGLQKGGTEVHADERRLEQIGADEDAARD